MVFCLDPKIEISRKDELEALLKVYFVNEGYLSIRDDPVEEKKFAYTLDNLVNQGFIKQANRDYPDIYGGGLTRTFVSIEDKGKEIIKKIIDFVNDGGKEVIGKTIDYYASLVE